MSGVDEIDVLKAKLKANPYTTIFGAIAGVAIALGQVEQLKDYATIFACAAALANLALGWFAKDKEA